jgi:hypothetical protein
MAKGTVVDLAPFIRIADVERSIRSRTLASSTSTRPIPMPTASGPSRPGRSGKDPAAPEHHDDSREHNCSADPVEAVRLLAVDTPAPKQRAHQEDTGVGGKETAVAILRLEGLYDRVRGESGNADERQQRGCIGSEPAPDGVRAAELAEQGEVEQAKLSGRSTQRASPSRVQLLYPGNSGDISRS